MLSQYGLPRKATASAIMDSHCRTALAFSMMQDQKLLTLRWRPVLGYRSNLVATSFAEKSGRQCDYGLMSSRSPLEFPWCGANNCCRAIDVAMTFIFRMWQRGYHLPILLLRQPIRLLWQDVTILPIDCRMCKTVNCWHSIDARFKHIEKAFVHPITVGNHSYTPYWHPILRLYVLTFVSRSFITYQCLISGYPRYLIERRRGPITFPRLRPAIDGM